MANDKRFDGDPRGPALSVDLLIAYSGAYQAGYRIGDTAVMAALAAVWAREFSGRRVGLTVLPGEPLNPYFNHVCRQHGIERITETEFDPLDVHTRYEVFDHRLRERRALGIEFAHYRELFRRVDLPFRARVLTGQPFVPSHNWLEHLYHSQEAVLDPNRLAGLLEPGWLGTAWTPPADPEILVAPHEMCQQNKTFTLEFWKMVVGLLLQAGVRVAVADSGTRFAREFAAHPRLRKIWPPLADLPSEIARFSVVCCGNTGVGWLAGAAGVPVIACEHDLFVADGSYVRCRLATLKALIAEPQPKLVVGAALDELRRQQATPSEPVSPRPPA